MALAEPEGMLAFQCVGRVVAFQEVLRVVEQHADVCAAVLIRDAQLGAGAYAERPVFAAFDESFVKHRASTNS